MHMYFFPEVHLHSLYPTRNGPVVQAHELINKTKQDEQDEQELTASPMTPVRI